MSDTCRWEDELAEKVEYNADGNVKTEIVKSPFIQVYLVFFITAFLQNSSLCYLVFFFLSFVLRRFL